MINLVIFLIGCLLDLGRAVVVYLLWGWFLTPWSLIVAPSVLIIWGLFIFRAAWVGVQSPDPEQSILEIMSKSLGSSLACLVVGFLIHLIA